MAFFLDDDHLLSNKEFFHNLPDEKRRLSFLRDYINDLESMGLTFDFSNVDSKKKSYIAIDCEPTIKFVESYVYYKEKYILELLKKYVRKTTTPEAEYFVNNQLRKFLYTLPYGKLAGMVNHQYRSVYNRIVHIIDYLNYFPSEESYILNKVSKENQKEKSLLLERERKSLAKLSFDNLIKASDQWTEKINNRASTIEDDDGIEIVYKSGDYFFVKLLSQQSYSREGKLMKHCVSSYHGKSSLIYSLRDKKNNPHVTIEISDNKIKQIKGKSNGSIKTEYSKMVLEFLIKKLNIADLSYLDGISLRELTENLSDDLKIKKIHKQLNKAGTSSDLYKEFVILYRKRVNDSGHFIHYNDFFHQVRIIYGELQSFQRSIESLTMNLIAIVYRQCYTNKLNFLEILDSNEYNKIKNNFFQQSLKTFNNINNSISCIKREYLYESDEITNPRELVIFYESIEKDLARIVWNLDTYLEEVYYEIIKENS